MEKIQPFFEPDERVLWSGSTFRDATDENHLVVLYLLTIVLLITNLGYPFLSNMFYQVSTILGISQIVLLIVLDIFLIPIFIYFYKHRKYGDLAYILTSKNIYMILPPNFKKQDTATRPSEFNFWRYDPQRNIAQTEKSNIEKIEIRASLGLRKWFGIKGYDVFLTLSRADSGFKQRYKMPQINGVPDLIKIVLADPSAQRTFEDPEFETYLLTSN